MRERIAKGLVHQFEKHRVVVWHDASGEMREEFEAVALPGIVKLRVENNEFGLKYRILRGEPKAQFLIYRGGPPPADLDNWLLDVELAHGAFRADQIALWRGELALPERFDALLSQHREFFQAVKRLEKLKSRLRNDDTETVIRLRMLAVCAGADGGLDTVLEGLLGEHAQGRSDALDLIARVGLTDFLWKQTAQHLGYHAKPPSLRDFALTLFKASYRGALELDTGMAAEAQVFFRRWQSNRYATEAYKKLSAEISEALGIAADLSGRDFRSLLEADQFEIIDRTSIQALAKVVAARTISPTEAQAWVRRRRTTYWFETYRDLYEAISCAAAFHEALAKTQLGMTSLAEGVRLYASQWYVLDQLYRRFIYFMRRSGQATLMQPLFEQIENHYVNTYLLRLNDAWQKQVDDAPVWAAQGVLPQRAFFVEHVGEFRRRNQRICVIVSDALRYEIAEELLTRIRSVDRYDASITPMLGVLPSYTQLGMAALLPHKTLQIADDDTSRVLVDGQSSAGLENRKKLLANGRPDDRADAIMADVFMGLNRDDSRALLSANDVLYIYHNQIDSIGEDRVTEDETFDAAEQAIEEIIKLVKKLNGANASNILVTSDHGFLYQHRPIEESDFSSAKIAGERVLFDNRRFALGRGLVAEHGLRKWTAEQVGLQGAVEILISKSINRLRKSGSGSRFVHGGATLQEVVVPVVTISKKRQSDLTQVEVAVIGANRVISSGQLGLALYQESPVTEKVQPRRLRIGIWSEAGELVSDSRELDFDSRSDSPRGRETSLRLILTRGADALNGKEIVLRFEEPVTGTTHYRTYRETRYTLRRAIASDFDF